MPPYGPAGKWIHDRAEGIMEDGRTPKSVAYAVATQQAHKVGKSPKDFRTSEGVQVAKKKYDEPKSQYQKTAAGGAAAIGAELLGAPGAAIGGYREGGWRGAVGGGGGALTGLGVGLGGRHLIKKHVTGGEFGRRHPIASTILESLPLAVGSTVGGAVGQHLMTKRGMLEGFFDELAKIAENPTMPSTMGISTVPQGDNVAAKQMPGVGGPQPAAPPAGQPSATGSPPAPMGKTGGLVDGVIKNAITNPVKYYAAHDRIEKGKKRHRQMMEAVEHPYPASWVPLGMRPRD